MVWMKEICTRLVKLYIIFSRMPRINLHARPSIIPVGCPNCCYLVCALDHAKGVLQTWIATPSPTIIMILFESLALSLAYWKSSLLVDAMHCLLHANEKRLFPTCPGFTRNMENIDVPDFTKSNINLARVFLSPDLNLTPVVVFLHILSSAASLTAFGKKHIKSSMRCQI